MKIGLRIVAATVRGARGSVRLAELLKRHDAGATFYFNLGPARLHPWLPGRHVHRRAAAAMRAVRDAGFDVGVYGWDPQRWLQRVRRGDVVWTEQAMRRACIAFENVFGESPRTHAAPGWLMNRHAFRLTQRLGYDYASDTRGYGPFVPVCEAELIACLQLPTTLPTIDEVFKYERLRAKNVHKRVLAISEQAPATGHIFSLSADKPRLAANVLERLIEGWRALKYDIVPIGTVVESLEPLSSPHHNVAPDKIPGRLALVAMEGAPFLA